MFEDSLVESRVFEVSSSKRWTTLASIGLQVAVAGVVIVLPLLHPEVLPFHEDAPKVVMPPLRLKPPVPVVQTQRVSASSLSMTLPSTVAGPSIALSLLPGGDAAAPSLTLFGNGNAMHDGLPSGFGDGHGPAVSIAPVRPAGRVQVSTGVLEGMLIAPIRPVYPVIAKASHVEGSVVVEAVISRTGTIESLHVVSGPLLLQSAAIDAIRVARYRPYRLNGEPTEVQTRITVNFRMNG